MAEKQIVKARVVANCEAGIGGGASCSELELNNPRFTGKQTFYWNGVLPIGSEVEITVKVK